MNPIITGYAAGIMSPLIVGFLMDKYRHKVRKAKKIALAISSRSIVEQLFRTSTTIYYGNINSLLYRCKDPDVMIVISDNIHIPELGLPEGQRVINIDSSTPLDELYSCIVDQIDQLGLRAQIV